MIEVQEKARIRRGLLGISMGGGGQPGDRPCYMRLDNSR